MHIITAYMESLSLWYGTDGGNRLQIYRIAANILQKQLWIANTVILKAWGLDRV